MHKKFLRTLFFVVGLLLIPVSSTPSAAMKTDETKEEFLRRIHIERIKEEENNTIPKLQQIIKEVSDPLVDPRELAKRSQKK